MTASERSDTRRRWALAATASLVIHLTLLLWWRGLDFAPGSGPAGGSAGGSGYADGFGSVIEVSIDVDAPVAPGATVSADEVAIESPRPTEIAPDDEAAVPAPADSSAAPVAPIAPSGAALAGDAGDAGEGDGEGPGTGSGTGTPGSGEGIGAGDGGVPGGVGARTGGSSIGTNSGTVPPRPVEITWPDTRRLAHCVGMRIDVRIRVDAQGRVEKVEPASQGYPDDCVRAALDTARRIKFSPGTVAGKPAALWSLVTIDFEKRK